MPICVRSHPISRGLPAVQPLRTTMNYQYRYGTTTTEAIKTLYADGGYSRYYQGLSAALVQGPVARFGDTAANAGILALLESNTFMKTLPSAIKTVFASLCAAAFRIILTPIDTLKTTLQTEGKPGLKLLKDRVCRSSEGSIFPCACADVTWRLQIKKYGITSLWFGALATAAATFAGNYPVSESVLDLFTKADHAVSGSRRTTTSKRYSPSRIPKGWSCFDKHSSGFVRA